MKTFILHFFSNQLYLLPLNLPQPPQANKPPPIRHDGGAKRNTNVFFVCKFQI